MSPSEESALRLAGTAGGTDNEKYFNELLIGRAEASRLLSIGERKLAELTSDGVIRSVKIGTRRLYPIDDLRQWIADGCPIRPRNNSLDDREVAR